MAKFLYFFVLIYTFFIFPFQLTNLEEKKGRYSKEYQETSSGGWTFIIIINILFQIYFWAS